MRKFYKIAVCSTLALFAFGLNFALLGQITSYPFTEGFNATSLPSGWTNEIVSGSTNWSTVTANGNNTITPRTGARMAEFRVATTGPTTKLVTPQLDLTSLTAPQLTFYFANTNWVGDIDELRIYYKSAAGDPWTQIGPAYTDEHTSWTEVSLALPSPSADYYVAFEGTSNWARGVNIDDVTIGEVPTCPAPTGLTSSNITENSVDLSWTPGGTETAWNVEWGASGFTPGTGTGLDSASVSAASHSISGLSPVTTYDVYVQADCGAGDESQWILISVQTACGIFTAPFLEQFSAGSLPACWTNTSSNTVANGLWKFSGTVDYASGNTRPNGTFAWVDGSDPSTISDVTLISPWIDVASLTTPTLFFDYFSNNLQTYPNNIITVEAREQSGAWTQIYTDNTSSNQWRELEFPLPAFSGTVVQVRFIVDKTAAPTGWAFYNDILLDNVKIDEPTTCPKPTLVTATSVGSDFSDITWTAGGTETEWNIVWGTSGFTPGDANQLGSDVATTNSYTVQGLSSSTSYDIYVQADCDVDGLSEWGNVVAITTSPECGDTITGLCYSQNSTQEVLLSFSATTGNWAELVFLAGGVETCCDEVIVYDGLNGTGNIIYGALTGGGLSDYSTVGPIVSTTGQLSLVINADGSNTCSSSSYTPFDVVVNCVVPPTCLVPDALTLENVTDETIEISWTAQNSETSWNVVWGAPGFTPGDANQIGSDVATTTSYTINGLTENTEYDVYVQADCGGGDLSSWAGPIEALTDCSSIPAIGFCEDFEDIDALGCWRIINANLDSDIWGVYTGYANSGTQSAGLYTDGNGGNNDDYLVLPRMTLTGNEILSFHYRARSSSEPNDFRVVLSTTGAAAADFTEVILPLMTISNTTYQDTSVNLSAYSGDVYIAFHVPPGGLDGWYVFIDDVCVDICVPVPGTDGTADVCNQDGTIDLNSVITSDYTHGNWIFDANPGIINGSDMNVSTLAAGSYDVSYVVTTACASDTTIATVNVFNPSSAGTDGMLTVCKNQMIDLYGGLGGTVDFGGTWYTPNGTPLTGSYFQTGTLIGQSIYKYVVSNGVCDADTSEVIVNIQNCDFLGLDDVSLLENVTIAPNPNTGKFQISGIPGSDYTFEVIDLNGRVVRPAKEITATVTDVNLTDVESGVYMIRIAGNNSERMIRVIKH